MQYQETDYLFWAISPQPLRHILSYLNFRMMSFWCLKGKAFYISLARLFRNREVFPWNLIDYLWQGGQWTNYPYLYLCLSLCVQMMDDRERYSAKIDSLEVLLHTKEIIWKFAFWYLFPLERGFTTGRWPRNSTSQGHQSTCPLTRLSSPQPNHWVAQLRWLERADTGPELHDRISVTRLTARAM